MLTRLTRNFVPAWVAQSAKEWMSIPRYWGQISRARRGYKRYGDSYSHPLLFVAGLPKSGTSWMESMLASYRGYETIMPSQVVFYEQKHGGSHDFELSRSMIDALEETLAVLKLHVQGSQKNVEILREAEIPHVVMYRDLRDVAVSHYFYVRRTPWHPEHGVYVEKSVEEGLRYFGRTLLPEFVDWIRSWREQRDQSLSREVRYEDLLADTEEEFRTVASHFDLDDSIDTIRRIVNEHRFENMSGGRGRGQQDTDSFTRKGVSGDWKNHFTDGLKDLFKEIAGQLLIDVGYESDLTW